MLFSTHSRPKPSKEFCSFLKKNFSLSNQAIELAIKKSQLEYAPLSIILLNYGMININQYQTLLDWIKENE